MNQKNSGQAAPHPKKQPLKDLAFFASPAHDCGYLPDRSSVTLFADPEATMDVELYGVLLEHGFRRSGAHVYRPHCPGCRACQAARIPVEPFQANRSQKRTQRKNTGIREKVTKPAFHEEHFALYRKYMASRHTGGGMDDPSEDKYMEFLTSAWADTEFVEFRLNKQLLAVATMDFLPQGLSSVYTFFDPEHASLSLGRFALLWQVSEAQHRHLPHLYLGYWIKNCQKMLYKQEYRPIELYQNNRWLCFDRQQELATASTP
jgi:arginyl-tRNA--protein-N-Asp/Glu arginylyltransferase